MQYFSLLSCTFSIHFHHTHLYPLVATLLSVPAATITGGCCKAVTSLYYFICRYRLLAACLGFYIRIYVYVCVYIRFSESSRCPAPSASLSFPPLFLCRRRGPAARSALGELSFFFSCLFIFRLIYFRVLVRPLFLNTTAPRAVQPGRAARPFLASHRPQTGPRLRGEPLGGAVPG